MPSRQQKIQTFLLNNIEIFLTIAGLLIVLLAAVTISDEDVDVWVIAALVSIIVSVINGSIMWALDRRRRKARTRAINDIREMLKDQVNNRLAVISMNSQLSRTLEPEKRKKMLRAIHEIDRMLDELSEDSFLNWKAHYRGDE